VSIINRREFLKTSVSGASTLAIPVRKLSASKPSLPSLASRRRYGTNAGRIEFRRHWKDVEQHPFGHQDHPSFHRLQTSLDVLYSRCEQPLGPLQDRPLRVSVKLLCYAQAGRTRWG